MEDIEKVDFSCFNGSKNTLLFSAIDLNLNRMVSKRCLGFIWVKLMIQKLFPELFVWVIQFVLRMKIRIFGRKNPLEDSLSNISSFYLKKQSL